MGEVLTVIEIVLAISGVVELLFDYGRQVKEAKDDIRRLTQELLTLKGTLEHFESHASKETEPETLSQVRGMLQMTNSTLETLTTQLGTHKSRLGRALGRLTWPYRSDEIQKHFETIERSKTWFIMVILKDSNDRTLQVYSEMKRLAALLHEDMVQRQTGKMLSETQQLLRWLAPSDAQQQLLAATKNKTPGTGRWIFDQHFDSWAQPGHTKLPCLWITGKSGSGKTVLFSSIVDKVQALCASQEKSRMFMGFHCCSLADAASQKLPNIFGSILAQVGKVRPDLLQQVAPFYRLNTALVPQNNLTLADLDGIFSLMLKSVDCLFILVDALNETPETDTIAGALLRLCENHPSQIRLAVTCTRSHLDPSPLIREIPMRVGPVAHDIEHYIQYRMNSDAAFLALSATIREEIQATISQRADGMFRWAKLSMDQLSTLRTGRDVRDALGGMPQTLNDTYVGLLERIPAYDRPIAREALLWLSFALRPLTLDELAEAVVLRESDTSIDDDSRLHNPLIILDVCQGLIDGNANSLTLAHDSVRSFLSSSYIRQTAAAYFSMDPSDAHASMMRKCLSYLRLDVFAQGPVVERKHLNERKEAYPLLNYATMLWPIHSERSTLSPSDEACILSFFDTKRHGDGSSFESWVQLLLDSTMLESIRQTEPLYYAASFNMLSVLKLLLRPELGVDVNRPGGRFRSPPLFVALWRANLTAAKMLLAAGADPDQPDGSTDLTSRRLAVRKGFEEVIKEMDKIPKHSIRRNPHVW
ncbi:ankyrin repeat protein [Stachybotrys elegans]|uniref:Ankyrin repeat protein n=1 Tax=Stachybotrys elegans TaxID=80388 RepID=A0A8K0T4K8_9HYPO|nr:ankyrin repeat protein [Stachybotrys elegans]